MAHDGQDVTNMTQQAVLPDLLTLSAAALPGVQDGVRQGGRIGARAW